jgi:formate hydrogenlyase transcriptional activator
LHGLNLYLRDEIQAEHDFEEMIGASAALRAVLQEVETVAGTQATVLITGETGTGKELIARAIHNRSARQAKPLIKLNCARRLRRAWPKASCSAMKKARSPAR